jgi:hypothetical protein
MSQETASLVLRSSDLTINASTAVGTANVNGTQLTWNNINLRTLLGDLYDKYDRFNLSLNTIATSISQAIGATADDRCTYITLSGLPWTNNTYRQSSGFNTNETVIGSCVWISGGQTTQYFYSNNTTTFGKNQDICNITITLYKISDNARPISVNAFPNMIYIFDITGVDEYRIKDVTQTRLLK